MPWQPIDISNEHASAFAKSFQQVSRFMVDENLGPQLATVLRNLGYNAADAFALKLNGRGVEDMYSAAWKDHRIVFTRGRDFFNSRPFPLNRVPGVVVFLSGRDDALMTALMYALSLVGKGREFCEGTKIVVGEDGRFTVTNQNQSGAREASHYKLRIGGPPLIWRSEKGQVAA